MPLLCCRQGQPEITNSDSQVKPKIIIAGKLPPPYMGPAVATEIILNSALKDRYHLIHLDTKANQSLNTLGKWSIFKLFKNFLIYFKLIALCLRKRPALVLIPISQTSLGFIKDSILILICRLCRRKVLIQLRGSDFKRWYSEIAGNVMRNYVRIILSMTCGVIVLGQKLRYIFSDFFDDKKIFVVPNGADYNLPSKSATHTGIIRFLYLGNLQTSKGIEDVIEAVKIVHAKSAGSFLLHVAGSWRDESTKKSCENAVAAFDLPVVFHVAVSGIKKFQTLVNADVFVFTPREPEGHPWVMVEALASGLPVISTDKGAITESVIHNVNGFIVPPKDVNAIAEAMICLIRDESLRKKMGQSSRSFYVEKFTEAKMVENFRRTFDEIINQ